MRFFTVKDAKEARKSVLYASGFIGYFFNVLLILGWRPLSLSART